MAGSSQGKRGIPRRAANAKRKAKYKAYRERGVCGICKAAFRSPGKKAQHVQAAHRNVLERKDLDVPSHV